MKIKTYQAATLQEAFQAIKSELGQEAVILTTKYVRKGWSLLRPFGRSIVEITAAGDETVEPVASLSVPTAGTASGEAAASTETGSTPINGFDEALRSSLGTSSGASGPVQAHRTLSPFETIGAGAHVLTAALTEDLIQRGCEPWTASWVVSEAVMRVPLSPPLTESSARRALQAALRDVIFQHSKMGGPLLTPNDRHKIVMLVGPTGGGKTLTAAKLAAHYRLKEGRSVALIKVESGRVSAVDPLQLSAATIGLGVDIVRNKRELTECLWLRRETDLVLIDTAGRSPLDHDAIGELRDCAASESTIEVHLVIPARTHAQDLADLIDRYAGFPIHRLVCTKLDETTRYGVLFDSLCRTKFPVSYFGVGQRVTDDLEVARSEEMVDLLLGRAGQSDESSHERPQPESALSGMRTGGAESPTPYGEDRRPSFEGGYTWISR